ncbi:hypothetical protein ACFLWY_05685, partial [Chloroflexota bacterium]
DISLSDDGPYFTTQTVVVNYVASDTCDADPVVKVELSNNGNEPVNITSDSPIELDLAELAGQNVITVTAIDACGNINTSSIDFEVILQLTGSQLRIEPETLKMNPGVFTAFVIFPAPYDAATISEVTADGASHRKINNDASNNKAIIKFNRVDLAILPVDTYFEVSGSFIYNGAVCRFIGSDEIKKVQDDEAPPENVEDSSDNGKKDKGK